MRGITDTVTANFVSWSDTQIVIHGFGGADGANGLITDKNDRTSPLASWAGVYAFEMMRSIYSGTLFPRMCMTEFAGDQYRAALAEALTLPCGAVLPNRLAKAAMTEHLADARNRATKRHERLYRLWSEGGAGLLLTGNVQVDRRHLEAPGNVAIAGPQDAEAMARLRGYARAGTAGGNHLWMQISHAGRQTPKIVNASPSAPSPVAVALPGGQFGRPVALTAAEIAGLITKFAEAAAIAREAGFTGVQIHAAHGYLISSFLSPRSNVRTDGWGGDLANRARFLMDTVRATRAAVGADFPVSVKLNSADFQRGGFSFEDSQTVARWLDEAGVDLIELSGGSYEQPRMMKLAGLEAAEEPVMRASTRDRESYFSKFAPEIRQSVTRAKLMVTGGFRTASGMAEAIAKDGLDVIGLARPLCVDPAAPGRLLRGTATTLESWETRLRIGPGVLGHGSPIKLVRALNGFGTLSWFYAQLASLADTGLPRTDAGVLGTFIRGQMAQQKAARSLKY